MFGVTISVAAVSVAHQEAATADSTLMVHQNSCAKAGSASSLPVDDDGYGVVASKNVETSVVSHQGVDGYGLGPASATESKPVSRADMSCGVQKSS